MSTKYEEALWKIASLDSGKTDNPAVKIAREVLLDTQLTDKSDGGFVEAFNKFSQKMRLNENS